MVGSEGTFGIVTQATLRLIRQPFAWKTLLGVFESVEDATADRPWHDLVLRHLRPGGRVLLTTGRTPREPAWLKALAPLLWPLGLHSVFVAEKPSGRARGAS